MRLTRVNGGGCASRPRGGRAIGTAINGATRSGVLALSGVLVVSAVLVGAVGCRQEQVSRRRPAPRDAEVRVDPREVAPLVAPRLAPPTAAERAYDAERRAALEAVVRELDAALQALRALARRGAGEPAFRKQWPAARGAFLERVGRLRTRVLEVDPLGRSSYGARVASRLLHALEVPLPNAVEESWDSRPGGALSTWSADFTLIWGQLRRYVSGLKNKPRKGTAP